MPRHFPDWIDAYLDYSKHSEAPKHMHFWVAVSAIAGALERKVWIDQAYFRWYPNFYICLVAPPGIVSKSSTVDIGIKLLRKVPNINFGPDIVTWPALVEAFASATKGVEYKGEFLPMSAMTLESSEFGNLLDPQDKQMVDLLVSLWDGKQGGFTKVTKSSGSDTVENPWINMVACTTPSWIAQSFPEYMIGGGFTSRTVFVYAERKRQLVSYPGRLITSDELALQAQPLIEDLIEISKLVGECKLTPEAYAWGDEWYKAHYAKPHAHLDKERFGGYLARKQTHIHKLAMVLSAARGDSLLITPDLLAIADAMVTDLEEDVSRVFSKIGKSDMSSHVDKLLRFVSTQPDGCNLQTAYKFVHTFFPSQREFQDVLTGLVQSGQLLTKQNGQELWIRVPAHNGGSEPSTN